MYEQIEKPKENKSMAVANSVTQKKSNVKQGVGFVDNRYSAIMQRQRIGLVNSTALTHVDSEIIQMVAYKVNKGVKHHILQPGDKVEIVKVNGKRSRVKRVKDDIMVWVDTNLLTIVNEDALDFVQDEPKKVEKHKDVQDKVVDIPRRKEEVKKEEVKKEVKEEPKKEVEPKLGGSIGFSSDMKSFYCGPEGTDPHKIANQLEDLGLHPGQPVVSLTKIKEKMELFKEKSEVEVRMLTAMNNKFPKALALLDNHHSFWAACLLGKKIKVVGRTKLKMPVNFKSFTEVDVLKEKGDTLENFKLRMGMK